MIQRRERGSRATRRRSRILLAACSALALVAVGAVVHAEEPAKSAVPVTGVSSPILVPARPYWPELTVSQREALKPLADDWERLDFQTKKKWVEIANRYPKMSPDEQGHTRDRMREWAMLTPDQRRVARDSFARIRAMPPEQRAEMLRKYQELPPERKQALATEGRAAKPLVVPKTLTGSPAAVPRRMQIREGAKDHNPALAARKSASPIVAPTAPKSVPPAASPPALPPASPPTTPVPTPPVPAAAVPVTGPAVPPPTPTASPTS